MAKNKPFWDQWDDLTSKARRDYYVGNEPARRKKKRK